MGRRNKQLSKRISRRVKERELKKINKAILTGKTFSDELLTTKITRVEDDSFFVEMDLKEMKFS